MNYAILIALCLSGCGLGATVGGTVGTVAGGAVDLVLRDGIWNDEMGGLE